MINGKGLAQTLFRLNINIDRFKLHGYPCAVLDLA